MSSQMAPTLIILVYYTTYVMVQERFEEIPRYLIVFTQSTPMPIIGLLGVMKNVHCLTIGIWILKNFFL
jgi:hypothetical protein